jgi:hypothetical protein
MAGQGGARPGAGRKTKAEELRSSELCMEALVDKFGSPKEAIIWLLNSKDSGLIKFAFEHAFGKPTDKIKHSGEINGTHQLIFKEAQNCQPIADSNSTT